MITTFRPVEPADQTFLYELYQLNRSQEMMGWGWSPEQQALFLQTQFQAQQSHYAAQFPLAEHTLILLDGQPIGQMIIARLPARLRLIDISLLPSHQGRGIGTAILQELLAEARQTQRPLELSVLPTNRATRLYQRLGFEPLEPSDKFYLNMIYRPA